MTNERTTQEAEPLRVGRLINDGLSWIFLHMGQICAVSILGTLIMTAINELIPRSLFNTLRYRENSLGISGLDVIDTANYLVGTTLVAIVITQLVGNEKAGRTSRPAGLAHFALRYFLPVFVFTLGYYAAIIAGVLALIIPGLFVSVIWALYIPALLLGGHGSRAFTSSAELTRGYRWPVFGATWLAAIISGIVFSAWEFVVEQLVAQVGDPGQIYFIRFIGITFGDLLVTACMAVIVALIYFRLIDIKEGKDIHELERVFE